MVSVWFLELGGTLLKDMSPTLNSAPATAISRAGSIPALAIGALAFPYPRVKPSIKNIHDGIDHHEDRDKNQHGTQNQRHVTGQGRVVDHSSHTRPGKDYLRDHGTSKKRTQIYCQNRGNRAECIP